MMDMKQVEEIEASWITEWERNFLYFTNELLVYEDINDIKYLIQTIKQQQEKITWLEDKLCQEYSMEADELYDFFGYKEQSP